MPLQNRPSISLPPIKSELGFFGSCEYKHFFVEESHSSLGKLWECGNYISKFFNNRVGMHFFQRLLFNFNKKMLKKTTFFLHQFSLWILAALWHDRGNKGHRPCIGDRIRRRGFSSFKRKRMVVYFLNFFNEFSFIAWVFSKFHHFHQLKKDF